MTTTSHPQWPAPLSRGDGIVAIIFLLAGGWIGARVLVLADVAHFYQHWLPQSVMWACGLGLTVPIPRPPTLDAFLLGTTHSFDCSLLASTPRFPDDGTGWFLFFYAHHNLAMAVALCWRLLGVSYANLWPVSAVLYGLYAAGCFVLFRLFFQRSVAATAAIVVTASPFATAALIHLRDFSKAPFIIWGVVLLILMIRERRPWRLLLLSIGLGVLIGIGGGFRSDVKLLLVIAVPALLLGLLRSSVPLAFRASSLALLFAVSLGLGAPSMLKGAGGTSGYFVLQGMTEPYSKHLGVTPVPYDLGYAYNDFVNLTGVAADLRRPDPEGWEATERGKHDVHSMRALTQANGYVLSWIPLFLGDLATRGLTSALRITEFYSLFARESTTRDPYLQLAPYLIGTLGQAVMPIMALVGFIGFFACMLKVYSRSAMEAGATGLILLSLMAAPGLQFSLRHLFHLEVFYWLFAISLVLVTAEFSRFRPYFVPFLRWSAVILVAGALGYGVLLLVQDRVLGSAIARIIAQPRAPLATNALPPAGDTVKLEVPIPPEHHDVVFATNMNFFMRSAADRLVLTIGGPACPPGPFSLRFAYTKYPPFNRDLTVEVPSDPSQRTTVIASVFYTPHAHFEGFIVPHDRVGCIDAIGKVPWSGRLPSSFTAVLKPDWKDGRLFQLPTLGDPFATGEKKRSP